MEPTKDELYIVPHGAKGISKDMHSFDKPSPMLDKEEVVLQRAPCLATAAARLVLLEGERSKDAVNDHEHDPTSHDEPAEDNKKAPSKEGSKKKTMTTRKNDILAQTMEQVDAAVIRDRICSYLDKDSIVQFLQVEAMSGPIYNYFCQEHGNKLRHVTAEEFNLELEQDGWTDYMVMPAPPMVLTSSISDTPMKKQHRDCKTCRFHARRKRCDQCDKSALTCRFEKCEKCANPSCCSLTCLECDGRECWECFEGNICDECFGAYCWRCNGYISCETCNHKGCFECLQDEILLCEKCEKWYCDRGECSSGFFFCVACDMCVCGHCQAGVRCICCGSSWCEDGCGDGNAIACTCCEDCKSTMCRNCFRETGSNLVIGHVLAPPLG